MRHARRYKNMRLHKIGIRLTGHFFNNGTKHHKIGVVIQKALIGLVKWMWFILGYQGHLLRVADALALIAVLGAVKVVGKINIVHHPRPVSKQKADGYAVVRKVRKKLLYIIIERKLALFHQHKDSRTGHRFGDGCQLKLRIYVQFFPVQIVGPADRIFINDLTVFGH